MKVEYVGIVSIYHPPEGWGVITARECPGGCWVHFSVIEMDGYRTLQVGEPVLFTVGDNIVDGFAFVADRVRRP